MNTNKKVLIKDIAEAVSCSPSTVSIVLAEKGDKYRISPSRQEEILYTAEEMGYFSSKSDSFKSGKDTLVLAIFISGFDYLPLRNMLHGMAECPSYGSKRLDFSLHPYQPSHLAEYEPIFTDKRYDGVIFVPSSEDDKDFLEKARYDFPCAIMTRSIKNYNSVTTNRYESGEVAAKIFLAHGYHRVAILRRNDSSKSGLLRAFGFVSTYDSSDIPDKEVTELEVGIQEDGYSAMNRLLSGGVLPEAVFIAEPFMLSGVLLFQRLGRAPHGARGLKYLPSASGHMPTSRAPRGARGLKYTHRRKNRVSGGVGLLAEPVD